MARQQQGLEKAKRAVVMLSQELKMTTQLLRAVTVRLLQCLQELRRNTGRLARENRALTTDSHLKV